jgi:hypothetical protein
MNIGALYWTITEPWSPLTYNEKVKCIKLFFIILEHVHFISDMTKKIENLKLFLNKDAVHQTRNPLHNPTIF